MSSIEDIFAKWVAKNIPQVFPVYYGVLEWSHFVKIGEKTIYFPDFGLHSKISLTNICWVDVKLTFHVDKEGYSFLWIERKVVKGKEWYNLDVEKHNNYKYVAKILDIPSYIVVYVGKNYNSFYWARVDNREPILKEVYIQQSNGNKKLTTRNLIPLEKEVASFKEEITKLV